FRRVLFRSSATHGRASQSRPDAATGSPQADPLGKVPLAQDFLLGDLPVRHDSLHVRLYAPQQADHLVQVLTVACVAGIAPQLHQCGIDGGERLLIHRIAEYVSGKTAAQDFLFGRHRCPSGTAPSACAATWPAIVSFCQSFSASANPMFMPRLCAAAALSKLALACACCDSASSSDALCSLLVASMPADCALICNSCAFSEISPCLFAFWSFSIWFSCVTCCICWPICCICWCAC